MGEGRALRPRCARRALLAHLSGVGVTLEELRAAVTSASTTDACATAVAVSDRVSNDAGLREARGAVGFGTVLFRDGDCLGPLLNVVARAVKAAEPGQVVVTAAVRALLGGDGRFRVGELSGQLRGIDDVVALAPLLR